MLAIELDLNSDVPQGSNLMVSLTPFTTLPACTSRHGIILLDNMALFYHLHTFNGNL